jgi:hypothetical protein
VTDPDLCAEAILVLEARTAPTPDRPGLGLRLLLWGPGLRVPAGTMLRIERLDVGDTPLIGRPGDTTALRDLLVHTVTWLERKPDPADPLGGRVLTQQWMIADDPNADPGVVSIDEASQT